MDPNTTIITLRKVLLQLLNSNILDNDGYLAEGTAVYFYFKHRFSVIAILLFPLSVPVDFFNF